MFGVEPTLPMQVVALAAGAKRSELLAGKTRRFTEQITKHRLRR
jgi:hypothetical protein